MARLSALLLSFLPALSGAVCDGNPHGWGRLRRCDQFNAACPDVSWQTPKLCEGIGGLANSDDATNADSFNATTCTPIATPEQLQASGLKPVSPVWPETFINTGFYEEQIFVHRDPFCLAQIPAMVSNGTHCFKRQQGTFNYDYSQHSLRIDYFEAATIILPKVNMTEQFYHIPDGTVHPNIGKYGPLGTPACPCIDLGVGPVKPDWAGDALYLGRERLGVEFLWEEFEVDHFVKGPHHVWSDVATGQVIRMYQPFNGLEVFDPTKYENTTTGPLDPGTFKLPLKCALEAKLGCINGTSADSVTDVGVNQAFYRRA
jgi:hypothetical protein